MDILLEELTAGMPNGRQFTQVMIRLITAILLGALIGIQRERAGKPAGFRTHILVSLGTTVFIVACSSAGMSPGDLSRIVQGVVTGIGFLGAGAILKLEQQKMIKGLTTAAGIWMTAAIGVAVGLGSLGVAIISTVLALIVLAVMGPLEFAWNKKRKKKAADASASTSAV